MDNNNTIDGSNQVEKSHHQTYLKDFRSKQCTDFLQHKCTQHRPYTCFNWHFANQKRRRPVIRQDGIFNYSSDNYCSKYDETSGLCPDGEECPLLHRTAGDTERRYHLRYYKTCPCVYETDSKGHCVKNGSHCAFAHGPQDLRKPVYDLRELQASETEGSILDSPLTSSLESDRLLNENPVWNDANYVLIHYKTELCDRPLRLCRQGYACPSYHNPRDKRRSPAQFKYRSMACPNVKQGDDWGDPSKCESGDNCGYCHTRTEQQFHLEIYKSTKCNDMVQTGYCPRGLFCAFAHVEQEMTMKWDIPDNNSTPLAAFIKDVLPSSRKDDGRSADGDNDVGFNVAASSRLAEISSVSSTPRKRSVGEFGDFPRNKDYHIDNEMAAGGGGAGAILPIPSIGTWIPEQIARGELGSDSSALSSSLNDSLLSNVQMSLRPAIGMEPVDIGIGPARFRQNTWSVGSYQQFCQRNKDRQQLQQQQLHLLQSQNIDTKPLISRYFPLPSAAQAPSSVRPLLPPSSSSLYSPQQQQHLLLLQQQPQALAARDRRLSLSFVSSRGADQQLKSTIDQTDDDLDLNLSDLNSALDQEFQREESNLNYQSQSGFNDSLRSSSNPYQASSSSLPILIPMKSKDGGAIQNRQLQQSSPVSSPRLAGLASAMFAQQQALQQQHQQQQQHVLQQQQQLMNEYSRQEIPGFINPSSLSGLCPDDAALPKTGFLSNFMPPPPAPPPTHHPPLSSLRGGPSDNVPAAAAVPVGESRTARRCLEEELNLERQRIMQWEEGITQAQDACEAWKKEAEKQERLLKQVEEERDIAVRIRDTALSKVAEMKQEIDLLSSAASPILHCLQRDVDFQQVPFSSLQQIHATLQRDYNVLEQKLTGMSCCYICKERSSLVVLHPCNHCVLCAVCCNRTAQCPLCGVYITQRSLLLQQP